MRFIFSAILALFLTAGYSQSDCLIVIPTRGTDSVVINTNQILYAVQAPSGSTANIVIADFSNVQTRITLDSLISLLPDLIKFTDSQNNYPTGINKQQIREIKRSSTNKAVIFVEWNKQLRYTSTQSYSSIRSLADACNSGDVSAAQVPFDTTGTGIPETNVQEALEYLKSIIPGATVGVNTLYVSEGIGDNATAQVGSYLFPFRDPWAARDTALAKGISSPSIIIFDGQFKWYQGSAGICSDCDFSGTTQPELSLIRNNFRYLSLPGVKFISGGGNYNPLQNCIFSDTTGYTCEFLGSADFELPTQTRLCLLQNPNADFEFQANSVSVYNVEIGAVFQITKTATSISQGGGFKNFDVNIKKLSNRGTVFVGFALWGSSPFLDTIVANSFNVNIDFLDVQNCNGIIRVDPVYANIKSFNFSIGTAQMQGTAGLGFQIFTLGRVGWINSRINLNIDNLITPTSEAGRQYIYGWTAGKVWTNTVQRLRIGSAVGTWRTFHSISTVAGGTGNKIYWDINGVNEDVTDPVYNFGAGGNAGYDMYISGNLLAKTPLFSYAKATGNITFLNFNAVTTGQLFTSTVSRTDSMFFLNSYMQGASSPTITGNFPMRTASSTFLPTLPTKNYKTVYSFGEQWRSVVFTATASQSTYTTSTARLPESGANIRVIVNGLEVNETTYYTYVASTGVITFVTPLSGGEVVKVSWYD